MAPAQLHGKLDWSGSWGSTPGSIVVFAPHTFSHRLYLPWCRSEGKCGEFVSYLLNPSFVPSPRVGHLKSGYHFPHNSINTVPTIQYMSKH